MTFEELNLNKALWNALSDLEYENPTPIQREAFSVIMSGKDIVGVAQTGTGKTFAYLLPLLRLHNFSNERDPRILILVPTRELVLQQVEEVEKLTTYMNLRVAGVYGGTNINTQKQVVMNGLDILIATPGRLRDLALSGALKLRSVRKLVIDEVDEMLNLGFRPQLERIFELLPQKRQNIMFSATLTEEIEKLITDYFEAPEKIEIVPHGTPLEKIIQRGYHVPNFFTKVNLLRLLLERDETMNKVLIFTGSKRQADRLEEQLSEQFPEQIGVIHSNKSQNFRINSLNSFHEGKYRILIATDIMARGLDISDVSHVLNFDMPEVAVDYIHRIGRTGRADRDGMAISFISDREQEYQVEIEALMDRTITLESLPEDLVISDELLPEEKIPIGGDKHYLKAPSLKNSKGAFHDKKAKNLKVNRAQEKRRARLKEKKKSKRKKKK
ncbi:MAG: DEAD/DEAH box helicase [Saprospiraceae bacterium]|nr:DEAD/DEAH box helicase [Saprospiraceae bacterium]MCB9322981.1 DEAD/DEAH box helicase [Lewinellaceae bacterium]